MASSFDYLRGAESSVAIAPPQQTGASGFSYLRSGTEAPTVDTGQDRDAAFSAMFDPKMTQYEADLREIKQDKAMGRTPRKDILERSQRTGRNLANKQETIAFGNFTELFFRATDPASRKPTDTRKMKYTSGGVTHEMDPSAAVTDPASLMDFGNYLLALEAAPTKEAQRQLADARNNYFVSALSKEEKQHYVDQMRRRSQAEEGLWAHGSKSFSQTALNIIGGAVRLIPTEGKENVRMAQRIHEISQLANLDPGEGATVSGFVGDVAGSLAPYAAASTAAAVTGGAAGGPTLARIGAGLVGFAGEGESAYWAAIDSGASEKQANKERVIVGAINALIESFQIDEALELGGDVNMRQRLIAAVSGKAKGAMSKSGKTFTRELAGTALSEGIEEFLQETTSIAVPLLERGEIERRADGSIDASKLVKRLGGAFLGGALGGAGLKFGHRAMYGQAADVSGPKEKRPIVIDKGVPAAMAPDRVKANAAAAIQLKTAIGASYGAPADGIRIKAAEQITPEMAGVENAVAPLGYEIVWFQDDGQEGAFNGWYNPNTPGKLYINTVSDNPLDVTAWHETIHGLEKESPDLYAELLDVINKHMADEPGFRNEVKGFFRSVGLQTTDESVTAEIAPMVMERLAESPRFMRKFGQKNTGLLTSIVERIRDFLDRFRNYPRDWHDKYLGRLDKFEADAAEVLKKIVAERQRRVALDAEAVAAVEQQAEQPIVAAEAVAPAAEAVPTPPPGPEVIPPPAPVSEPPVSKTEQAISRIVPQKPRVEPLPETIQSIASTAVKRKYGESNKIAKKTFGQFKESLLKQLQGPDFGLELGDAEQIVNSKQTEDIYRRSVDAAKSAGLNLSKAVQRSYDKLTPQGMVEDKASAARVAEEMEVFKKRQSTPAYKASDFFDVWAPESMVFIRTKDGYELYGDKALKVAKVLDKPVDNELRTPHITIKADEWAAAKKSLKDMVYTLKVARKGQTGWGAEGYKIPGKKPEGGPGYGEPRPSIKGRYSADDMPKIVEAFRAKGMIAPDDGKYTGGKFFVLPQGEVIRVLHDHGATAMQAGLETPWDVVDAGGIRITSYGAVIGIDLPPQHMTASQKDWLIFKMELEGYNRLSVTQWAADKETPQGYGLDMTGMLSTPKRAVAYIDRLNREGVTPSPAIKRKVISKALRREYIASIPKGMKARIAAATGMKVEEGERFTVTQEEMLKNNLRLQQKASEAAYKSGQAAERAVLEQFKQARKVSDATRKELAKIATKYIPADLRGKLLNVIANARTPAQFRKATEKIEQYVLASMQRDEVKRLTRIMRGLQKYRRAKGKGFKVGPATEDALTKLLDSFSIAGLSVDKIQELGDLQDMAQTEEAAAIERVRQALLQQATGTSDIADVMAMSEEQLLDKYPFLKHSINAALKLAEQRTRTSGIKKLPPESIHQIGDAILLIMHDHQVERILIGKEKKQEFDAAKKAILSELDSSWHKTTDIYGKQKKTGVLPKGHWARGIAGYRSDNLQTLSRILSGMKEGQFYKYLAADLAAGLDEEIAHYYMMKEHFRYSLSASGITDADMKSWSRLVKANRIDKKAKLVTIPLEQGRTIELSVMEMIDVLMHTKNPENYAALTGKNGIRLHNERWEQLTPDDVQTIIDAIPEKARQLADIFAEGIELQTQLINQVSNRLEGYDLANVPNYWHIPRWLPPKVAGKKPEVTQESIESRGSWKERTGGDHALILDDAINKYLESVNVASEYIGMAEPMRNARMILHDSDIRVKAESKGYGEEYRTIITLVQRLQEAIREKEWHYSMIGKWSRNITRSVFAYNPRLALEQYTAVFLGMDKLPTEAIVAIRPFTSRKALRELDERINRLSPYIRMRDEGHIGREIGDVTQTGSVYRFVTDKDVTMNKTTKWIRDMDRHAIRDIWRMVEWTIQRDIKKGKYNFTVGSSEYNEKLVSMAEAIIRDTQSTWHKIDRSLIGGTTNPWGRAVTMFYSQREKMLQMLHEANARYANSGRTAKDKARLGRTYGLVLGNVALTNAWKWFWRVVILRQSMDVIDWFVQTVADVFGLVYWIGPIANAALQAAANDMRGRQSPSFLTRTNVAAFQVGDAILEMNRQWWNLAGVIGGMNDKDLGEQMYKTMLATMTATEYACGLPRISSYIKTWQREQGD